MLQLDELQFSQGLGVVAAKARQPVDGWFCPFRRCAVPSVIALLECREALAREELESRLEAAREADEHVAAARQRVDPARIARKEVLRALAEEGEVAARRTESEPETASVQDKVDDSPSVTVAGPAAVAAVPVIVGQAVPTGTGGGRRPRPAAADLAGRPGCRT
ncbi:outer membrane translocation and assembly module TamA [Streptacidiphilus sp. MAP12-16]|uniref:hypothetical protein n=1 Tax=Streptacidiphilus sp. MAP12-16 TaxID=3156300 RepID=UPI003516FCFC